MATKQDGNYRVHHLICILFGGLGILFLVGGIIRAIIKFSDPSAYEPLLGAGLACFFMSAVLLLLITLAVQGEEIQKTLELLRLQIAGAPLRAPSPEPPQTKVSTVPIVASSKEEKHDSTDISRTQVLELLQQIRDVSLMNDAQLQHVAARHWTKRKEHLRQRVERYMLSGDWPTAKARLDELQALLPDDADVKQLAERISEEHALRLDEDLKVARSQLKQLYKINAWQEAEEIVLGLEHKYPHDREVGELTREVENKMEAVEREIRERLLSNVTEATGKHDWARGVSALEEFLHRFPTDTLADRLRVDLLTLRENAGAQERKEQEALFKDLLKQHEYEKADNLAKSLIEKYPTSSTAAELAKLLPKVEELMHQEKLKRPATDATPPGGLN